jgi:cytochrome c-type biogenesis protein
VTSPLLALAAGALTVAAPCVLPMLPVVLGASVGQRKATRPLFIALGFASAFCVASLVFGSVTRVLPVSQEALRHAATAMLLLFGVFMLWPAPGQWLAMRASGVLNRVASVGDQAGNGNFGGFLLGLSLGAVWTPCAGPVLASILTLIATEPDTARAALLLACYSVGAAVPMLAIAYGGQVASTRVRQLARHAHRMQQVFGAIVIAVAVATFFQLDGWITVWVSQFYPQGPLGL